MNWRHEDTKILLIFVCAILLMLINFAATDLNQQIERLTTQVTELTVENDSLRVASNDTIKADAFNLKCYIIKE